MNKTFTVIIALVCGTMATVFASKYLSATQEAPGLAMTEIFVAVTDIEVGDQITPERIKLEQWPADRVPSGATGDLETLRDKFAKQRFYEGEAIMPVKLMDENWTEVPRSYRVVAMNASQSGISNLIQPGDRVDVNAFFQKNDLIPQSTTQTVLRGVRVYALDGDTQRREASERPQNVRNIQLLLHETETRAWELAQRLGDISLLVSNDGDQSEDDKASSEAFIAWLTELQDRHKEEESDDGGFANLLTPPAPAPVASAPKPVRPKGYKMIKHSGGQMVEYWIVPGQLPRLIGVVGETGDAASGGSPLTDSPATADTATASDDDPYSYLNGDSSPFYESDDQS